jgi:peptidase C39-like protein/uncharacterized protein DUF1573
MAKKAVVAVSAGLVIALGIGYLLLHVGVSHELDSTKLSDADRVRLGCGPISLGIAAQLIGHQVTPRTLLQECRFRTDGVDTRELRRLASVHGLELVDTRLDWNTLLSADSPVILHYPRGHFVVANPQERHERRADVVRIYDSVTAARFVTQPELNAEWNGRALIVRTAAQSEGRSEDKLGTDRWWIDLGVLPKDIDQAEYAVRLENRGDSPLSLRVDDIGCSCASAELDNTDLAPGESTFLRAAVELERKRGAFFERVWIAANEDDSSSNWCLTLSGTAVEEVALSQRAVYLGDVHPGEPFFGSVAVNDRGDGSLIVNDVDIVVHDSEQRVYRPKFTSSWSEVVAKSQDASIIRRHPAVIPGDWVVQMEAPIPLNAQCGVARATMRLVATTGSEDKILECEVHGRIVSDVEVAPRAVLIRSGVARVEVVVSRNSARPVEIEECIVESLQGVRVASLMNRGPNQVVVLLEADPDSRLAHGSLSGQLRLVMGRDGERVVPITRLSDN